MTHSRRFKEGFDSIDRQKEYDLDEAVALMKSMPAAKFDETIEISVELGVDTKHADQQIRGSVSLPHGIGKNIRVLAIVKGPKHAEAEKAGADMVGYDEYLQKIKDGWTDTDVIVATPDAMGDLGKLGRILGPRGLMPNPKSGTVTMDIEKTVKELKAGRIEIRTDKFGIIHNSVGKMSFDAEKLSENIKVFVDILNKMKPAASKGTYFKGMFISSTMGPGIKIEKTSAGAK